MAEIAVEYVAGPLCGQRTFLFVGPAGKAPAWLSVRVPAKWVSALDDEPIPESTHLYLLSGPDPTGQRLRYSYRGPQEPPAL